MECPLRRSITRIRMFSLIVRNEGNGSWGLGFGISAMRMVVESSGFGRSVKLVGLQVRGTGMLDIRWLLKRVSTLMLDQRLI